MNSYDCLLISLQRPQYYIKQPLQKYCSATFLRQSHIKVIYLYTLYSSVPSTFHKKDEMCAHFFALPIFQSKLANTSHCVKELLKICIPRKFYIQFFFVFAIQILLFISNTLNTHILLPHMSEKIIWKSANVTYILPEVLEIKHSLKREEVKIKRLILLGCLYRQYRKASLKGNQNYETKYSHLS